MSRPWPPGVFVLIPAYRAAESLSSLLPALRAEVPGSNICVVDDGSRDGTDALCREFGVEALVNDVNQGKGAALVQGFGGLLSKGAEWIITMDADGQHAVSDLPVFLDAIGRKPGHAIIIGSRRRKLGEMPWDRICSNAVTSLILSIMTGVRIKDSQCGYRAYHAGFFRGITIECRRFEMESEVILKACLAGLPVGFVDVQTVYSCGSSHIAHCADTARWIAAVLRIRLGMHGRRQRAGACHKGNPAS